jgi:hypothetical protein
MKFKIVQKQFKKFKFTLNFERNPNKTNQLVSKIPWNFSKFFSRSFALERSSKQSKKGAQKLNYHK